MTQSSRAVPDGLVDMELASASVRPEPGSVESMAPLVAELRALADCDSRAGEPLGKCMRKAADKIERLSEHADYIEAQWVAKAGALSAKDRELAEARERCQMWFDTHDAHRKACDALGKANGELMKRAMDAERRATTAERERDEAMAALREKEERVKTLEEAVRPFAEKAGAYDGIPEPKYFGDTDFEHSYRPETRVIVTLRDLRRARSVLSSVQPVSGSREQRGNEEGRS